MGRSEKVRLVGELPGVDLVGPVAELAPEYAAASMLVVPLRAGSGTRIKILEAFIHRTPVVSTSIGAEGLAVTHGEHLLIADTPAEFADCCLRLDRDPVLRDKLVSSAYEWVVREHSIETVRRTICDCLNNSKAQ
jgi:glycosyltransferase involved in cell wall biosynthesis